MRSCSYLLAALFAAHASFADPVISEFLASNKKGLADDDGDRSDWVEIHNPDAEAVDLTGWALTDNASNLRKWIFPAVTIPAGGYLVVFASNKNRRFADQPLHTNFALSADGEYLALVKPDGATRTTEFAPTFPPQAEDVSYGVSSAVGTVSLLAQGTPARGFAPVTDALGSTWTAPEFDDAAWSAGKLGAGFFNSGGSSNPNLSGQVGLNLLAYPGNQRAIFVRVRFNVADPADILSLRLRLLYDDGFVAYLNGRPAASGNVPGAIGVTSLALSNHPPVAAEEFDLSGLVGELVPGENVLALHGLNVTAGSSDLFLLPELVAEVDGAAQPITGYFRVATPGVRNGGPQSIELPQVVTASRPSGPYAAAFALTLSGAVTGQEIRYVISDPSGSPGAALPEPTLASTRYAGPISITTTTARMIRAAVFDPATGARGRTVTFHYVPLESSASGNTSLFESELPIFVTDDHGAGQPVDSDSPLRTTAMIHVFEPVNGVARLDATPTFSARAGLRVRGSSSAGFPKKSLGLEIWDEKDADRKVPLLGMAPEADWVLNGPWLYDDAYIRNAVAYELSRQMGRWAPRTRFVEMFSNWNGGKLNYADYGGVYVVTEKIESGKERVKITGISPADVEGDALTGGYIFKIDRVDPDEFSWTTNNNVPRSDSVQKLVLVEPDVDDDNAEQTGYLTRYVQAFDTALFAEQSTGFATRNYRRYIDVPSWVDHHIINALMCNIDGLRLSAFFHKDRDERIQAGPVWDFDRSANSDDDRDNNATSWNSTEYYFTADWWGKLFQDADFAQAWVDRWFELRAETLSDANIGSVVDGYGAQVGNAAGARDAARWPDNAAAGGVYLNEVTALNVWLTAHARWIDSRLPAPPTTNLASGVVPAGTTVTLVGSGIRYQLDGTDPRPAGGGLTPLAPGYSTPLVIDRTTVLTARRRSAFNPFPGVNSLFWSAPLRRVYLVNEDFAQAGDLAVSEVDYRPAAPTAAESAALPEVSAGDFQFIELRNVGDRHVNTFEMALENPQTPLRPIPLAPLTLAPGDTALIVKRKDAFVLRYGPEAASRIAGEWGVGALPSGGNLRLVARDGTTAEAVSFPDAASPRASVNRRPDGSWQADAPSPGGNGPTFAQWRNYHFPAGGSDAEPTADPDGDDVSNGDEYAHLTDPRNPDGNRFESAFSTALSEDGTEYHVTFTRPANRPSARYDAEETADLVNWNRVPDERKSISGDVETRQARVKLGAAAPGGHYYRLNVTVTP